MVVPRGYEYSGADKDTEGRQCNYQRAPEAWNIPKASRLETIMQRNDNHQSFLGKHTQCKRSGAEIVIIRVDCVESEDGEKITRRVGCLHSGEYQLHHRAHR